MAKNSKDFLVSTADVAFKVDGQLAFTGTTALNTSISVSMEDQEVTGGKGSKTQYKYKYGRKVNPTIEMADWKLEYIAANVGSKIAQSLRDVYAVAECVTLTKGTGTLAHEPISGAEVFVEKEDGTIAKVKPSGSTITVGSADANVKATYQYSKQVKNITIDADSAPLIGELVLTADKHNNRKGKVGQVQIVIPSFQPNGTFDISLEAEGVTSTTIEGDALAVEGATCTDGDVYGYVYEFEDAATEAVVSEIAATPSMISLKANAKQQLSIIGIREGLYSNVDIDPSKCKYESDNQSYAKANASGEISAVAQGTANITVTYGTCKDIVQVKVTA